MSHFEYISVLISIVLAFALSEILSGWGQLIRGRERVRFSWLHLLLTLFVALLVVQWWHGFWEYRVVEDWSFTALLVTLAPALTLVVISFVATPTVPPQGELDLGDRYLRNRRWIYALGALELVLLAITDAVVGMEPFWHAENGVRGLGVGIAACLAVSGSRRVHATLLILAYAALATFVTLRFVWS